MWHDTNACRRVRRRPIGSDHHVTCSYLSWKLHNRHTFEMCCQDDVQRTCWDYVQHWLAELLHCRREDQELTKFFDVASCTTQPHALGLFVGQFSLFNLIHAQSSLVYASKALKSASSCSGVQHKYNCISSVQQWLISPCRLMSMTSFV